MDDKERRLKVFYLDTGQITHFLNYGNNLPEYITVPAGLEGVPEGARVVSVHNSYERRALGIVVEHESFGVVNEAALLPASPDGSQLDMRAYKLSPLEKEV